METGIVGSKKLGIDKLLVVVLFMASFFSFLGKLFEGGTFNPTALGSGLMLFGEAKDFISSLKEGYQQALDLDEEEKNELNKRVSEKFSISNKEAEALIERSFNTLTSIFVGVLDWKKYTSK